MAVASAGWGHLVHLGAIAVPMLALAGYVLVASLRASHRRSGSRTDDPGSAGAARTAVTGAASAPRPAATAADPDEPGVPAWSRTRRGVYLPAPRTHGSVGPLPHAGAEQPGPPT